MIVEFLLATAIAIIAFLYIRPLVYAPAIDLPLAWGASLVLCLAATAGIFLRADFSFAITAELPFSRGIVPADQMGFLFNGSTLGSFGALFVMGATHFFELWRYGEDKNRGSILAQMAFFIAASMACVSANLLVVVLYIEIALIIGALIGPLFNERIGNIQPKDLNRYLMSRVLPLLGFLPLFLLIKMFGSFDYSGVLSVGVICYAFSILGLEGMEKDEKFGVTFFMVRAFLMIVFLIHALGQFKAISLNFSFAMFFVGLFSVYGLWTFINSLAETVLEKGFDYWQRLAVVAIAIEILILNLDSQSLRLTYFGFLAVMAVARNFMIRANEARGIGLFARVTVFSLILILFEHPEALGVTANRDFFDHYQKLWLLKPAMVTLLGLSCGRLFVVDVSNKVKGGFQSTVFASFLFLFFFLSITYVCFNSLSIDEEKIQVTLFEVGSSLLLSLMGLLAGLFLGGNKKFSTWITGFQKKLTLNTALYVSTLVQFVGLFFTGSLRALSSILNIGQLASLGGMLGFLHYEELLSDRLIVEKISSGLGSLSFKVRLFHSGNIRYYLFFGMVFMFLGSFLYLVV